MPYAESTLLELPTPAHQGDVAVYYAGETRPDRAYLPLAYLSARQIGHGNVTTLVYNLKKQARETGADGIIVWPPGVKSETHFYDEWVSTTSVSDMVALAFIFPENLKFIPGLVKSWNVYGTDVTGKRWEKIASQPFDFKGNPIPLEGSRNLFDWWYKKSNHFLLESPGIRNYDSRGRLRSRLFFPDQTKVRITYNPRRKDSIKAISLMKDDNIIHTTIEYQYEEDGKTIKSREIRFAATPATSYIEYPEYDEEGWIKGYLYVMKTEGYSEQCLRMEYEYYTEEEWEAAVEDIVRRKLVE